MKIQEKQRRTFGEFDLMISYWPGTSTTGTSTNTTCSTYSTSSATQDSWSTFPRLIYKIVWVKFPKHWDKKIVDAQVRLVNDETHTGWKITALVNGHVEVVDPYADIRDMKDFVLLLKASATAEDRKKIDAFFKRVGLEGKPKRKRPAKKP